MNPLVLAGRTVWNHQVYRAVRRQIALEAIDLLHVHNTLPLASPAVYYAASASGVPVVQTLHNYRLMCANGSFVRDAKPCVSCVGTTAQMPAVVHACYRGSRAATGVVAAMLLLHRAAGTWQRQVDTYIVATEFARGMFVAGGLPADRIVVKPHFVDPDPGVGSGRGGYALYVGRLSTEKGIVTLLDAWARLDRHVPLIIAGDGPLAGTVADAAARRQGVTWLGQQDRASVRQLMAEAAVVIFPSIAYETFGQVIIEAYAAGTPVIASSGGAAAELVEPGRTGALVRPGDPADLADHILRLLAPGDGLDSMRRAARAVYEARFTARSNYPQLQAIYHNAMVRSGARASALPARPTVPAAEAGA
jgi:glycosyltransferase involved in cell wall biosynthesis